MRQETIEAHGLTIIELEGVPVAAETRGEGPTVLLLHGWGADSSLMRPLADRLVARHRVCIVDLPGFGQSPPPPAAWDVHDYARLVARLIEQFELAPVAPIGHSFGGRLAIVLAAEHPALVRQIVLVDSAGVPPPRRATWRGRVRKLALSVARVGARLPIVRDPAQRLLDRLRERWGSPDYRTARGIMRPTFVKVVTEDLRPLMPRIKVPTLLVWGSNDPDTPLSDGREMERLIPDAGLVVLAGAGHYSYLERLSYFARIVESFLASPVR